MKKFLVEINIEADFWTDEDYAPPNNANAEDLKIMIEEALQDYGFNMSDSSTTTVKVSEILDG